MSDLVLKHLAPKGYLRAAINLSNFLLVIASYAVYKIMQGKAIGRPEIAQRKIEKAEESIGATGLEPAT